MQNKSKRHELLTGQIQRMDFLVEWEEYDPVSRSMGMRMVPDPRRYERRDVGGRTMYFDRFTNIAIALDTLVEAFNARGAPLPLTSLPPLIPSVSDYASGRRVALQTELRGEGHVPAVPPPQPSKPFNHGSDRDVAFVSLDVVGATALRVLDPARFDQAFEIMVRELGTLVGHFSGSLLKGTGDGFIAYVDQESILARDNAVDLSLSMLTLLRDAINPALAETGLPELRVRIGADQGPARIRTIPMSTGFMFADVVSDALNRAVKLQEAAPINGLLIGESLRDQLHVGWMERATAVDLSIGAAVGLPGYRAFVVE